MRSAAPSLIVLGLLGVAFFLLTDPRWGYGLWLDREPGTNVIDAIQFHQWGTYTGLAGSVIVTLVGVWRSVRKLA